MYLSTSPCVESDSSFTDLLSKVFLVLLEASIPKHCTSFLGSTVSGVSNPINLILLTSLSIFTSIVSPSTTLVTLYNWVATCGGVVVEDVVVIKSEGTLVGVVWVWSTSGLVFVSLTEDFEETNSNVQSNPISTILIVGDHLVCL